MADILYIVIPAYNEEENLERLIGDWYPVIERCNAGGKSRLVVIDDGSRDGTWKLLEKLAQTRPWMQPLHKPNGGHGPTLLYGYRYAIEQKADYIFQTDADGQTLAAEFEGFWNLRETYDAVIGKRPDRQDGFGRKVVEAVLGALLFVVFGVRVPDANAPFRLMKRTLLEKYIGRMPHDYNLPNVMLTTWFVWYRESVMFRSVTFRPRQGGVNSINVKKITGIGWKAIADFLAFRKEMRQEGRPAERS